MDTIHTIGRRKEAVARIYLSKGKGKITVNGKDFKEYFPVDTMQYKLEQPFKVSEVANKFDVKVNVDGGGTTGQAEAIRLAISRALCELDQENRPALKAEGLLTRDARVVERKKPGQKKARKKFQWVKR
ncbi:30S ribosomal protein S9 [Flavobacteriales bacterium]|jgi:small subunit ribosomal protein S9|nr:30S ribosomal protein S9 [Flavobacteriales bacterium]MBT4344865.1 30S ribosomal protein S9 [Flavobacteriales bacterium]MDA7578686.1 30S ribosomal protein S9 [Flavobacteriales bacterium]MDA7596257.1 30S ribosomal protein S9 [Flavobacteriales bacterium]MDC0908776.1 30S ribosomal protein S9 [Flavobacteriales bacterium]|tara:strand:+ start:106 stop:492 length:387 start_codon:yes stop_codon:yes gene_type:complete